MNSMVRERGPHASRLFIEVTPGIRRALELLAEASITLLDEIDAPVDELEADLDFEITLEDDEDGHDAESETDEPDLGWTEEGDIGRCDDWTGSGNDEDFVAPETSGGFAAGGELLYERRAEQKARFDPRLDRRGGRARPEIVVGPDGQVGYDERTCCGKIPPFPHDLPGRPAFMVGEEIRRLSRILMPKVRARGARCPKKVST